MPSWFPGHATKALGGGTIKRCGTMVLLSVLAAGCGSDAAAPIGSDATPAYAKPAKTDVDPRLIFVIHSVTTDGAVSQVSGDGRDVGGATVAPGASSSYQGDVCGVFAKLFALSSTRPGEAYFEPGRDDPSGCAPRVFYVDLGTGPVAARHVGLRCVEQTEAGGGCPFADVSIEGATAFLDAQVVLDVPGCTAVQWNNEVAGIADSGSTAGQVRVTYVGLNADGGRVWLAESQVPHAAGCWNKRTKATAAGWDGMTRIVPFSFEIHEVM